MNKIIIIGAVAIIGILLFAGFQNGLISPFADNYGTGRTINTTSVKNSVSGSGGSISIDNPYIKTENALNHNDIGEIFDSNRYIVSWQPNEYSKAITARVDASFKTHYDRLWSLLYGLGEFPVTFIRNNYWWEITYTDLSGKSVRIVDGKNFTGGSTDTSVKTEYIHVVQGYPRRAFPNTNIQEEEMPSDSANKNWWAPPNSAYSTETVRLETEVFVFEMKGNRVGSVNIKCYLEDSAFAHHDTGIAPIQVRLYQKTGPVLLSEDNAYLPTGRGEVRIESTVDARQVGWEKTLETNIQYQVLGFEEGSNITFSIDTGYSGISVEPDQEGYREGWYLQIINSKGTTVKTYPLSDGLKNYKMIWQVPKGSFIANDPNDNEWMAVLSNTLFDQSETRIFVVDSYAKTPGIAKVTVESNQIDQFETITWSASASPNPNGTNDIHHFRVWAVYGSPTSTDYALTATNYPAIRGGDKYTATGAIQAIKGDKYVYVYAMSIDSQGRSAIGAGYQSVFVKQVIPSIDGGGGIGDVLSENSIFVILLVFVIIIIIVLFYIFLIYRRKRKTFSKKGRRK